MTWAQLISEVIDLRSFSNLWYWIALAVTWSHASHWIIGIPFDMVMRARRMGGAAEAELEDFARLCVNRTLYIAQTAGGSLLAVGSAAYTCLGLLGFYYGIEIAQAVFLILFPLSLVALLSTRTASRIARNADTGAALHKRLSRHRVAVQAIGVVSILVTATWGMIQNVNIPVLPN
ncbi:component of SufBCD complex [Albidovulum sp.]|uniref:component of SufBCD complex n=1 Tax=Albidovulum sp. TaxID=1872424 RepID=UPI001E04D6C9|nr:component of SufBCD complex [Paracoccaceae bacterium]HPE25320.1 component of SufBCD complex [Albidovulum sp.]MCB2118376.1 component of SufBCD complex [Paracoccaceae bacterium]MCB2121324.1 component of SufBCD complex [Paracoccaceae bacterium]MCB2139693.1 component of SufBCD complex [Paracoccaceae bacterium]